MNPKADDLDHVIVVLNLKRQPRGKGDGTILYSGSAAVDDVQAEAGHERLLALFAVDRNGNAPSPPGGPSPSRRSSRCAR